MFGAAGTVAGAPAAVTDVRGAIAFSALGVLVHYAVTNAAARTPTPAGGSPTRIVPPTADRAAHRVGGPPPAPGRIKRPLNAG